MRKHNGMRPQDIVVLLKLIALGTKDWQNKDLANTLFISASEIGESLNRNHLAGLINFEKKKVNRQSLYEFLKHGLHYVFPQQPGSMVNGFPTAHCHPFILKKIKSNMFYVWPDSKGDIRGLTIEPLYQGQVEACKIDPELYKLLALIDIFRVGRLREIEIADKELCKMILHEA